VSQKAKQRLHESIFAYASIPNTITIANAVFGLLSIFHATIGEYKISAALMLAAVVADFADGRIARWLKEESDFGKHLDSLSDTISFGIAPAVFGYSQGLDSNVEVFVLCFFLSCGILRLARFGIIKRHGFVGVPITTNGIIFPVLFLLFGMFQWWAIILYLVMGVLMISSLRIPKV